MADKTVLLLHGFPSSGRSSKALYFENKFAGLPDIDFHAIDFNPTPKDFEHMTITGMIDRLRQYILDHNLTGLRFIASSAGALIGLHYTARFGEVDRLLLLAPLLYSQFARADEEEQKKWEVEGSWKVMHFGFKEELPLNYGMYVDGLRYDHAIPPPAPLLIVHGTRDEILPIENSKEYVAAHPKQVQFVEVDSDHRLMDQLDTIWALTNDYLLQKGSKKGQLEPPAIYTILPK